jgi:hypothetical protein
MKKESLFLVIILSVILLPFISAACTVTLDKEVYVAGETATAAMSCSTTGEKNTDYTLNWTNQSGNQFEVDEGTTPQVKNQLFYQSYTIPASWPDQIFLNASLSGDGLSVTQNDSANVTSTGGSNSLLIVNSTFGGGFIGKVGSIQAKVTNGSGKKISGGFCKISGWSNDETKMLLYQDTTIVDGEVKVADIMSPNRFDEGTDYAYKILCYCGSDVSMTECIDEDGVSVIDSIGSTKGFFTTSTWLTVNTVTDKSLYSLKEEIFICANVTNVNYSSRIPLEIQYQARCSKETDLNSDTDRILINYNRIDDPDLRGISTNTTQMQCKKFVIPEEKYLMGRNSQCYASTNVWVLDNSNEELMGYATTSSSFNISSDEINLEADWQWIGNTTINSIINLSNFDGIDASGTGNIDLRLNVGDLNIISIFELANILSNITVKNTTTTLTEHTDYEIEFLEDGFIELEIRDTNLSTNWFNVTLDFYNNNLRQTQALEGINSKTGTFHMDVACPSGGEIGEDLSCIITAYVEDSQTVQKEVDFTCYITDGSQTYSSLNFNHMVTRTPSSISKNFAIPLGFNPGQQYVLQCHADYYNLGSRRDSFYDTFTTNPGEGGSFGGNRWAGGAPITGGIIDEEGEGEEEDKITLSPISKKMIWIFFLVLMIIILFKFLNIRGEIKFGQDFSFRKCGEDKRVSRLQNKLNKKVIKNDLKREKSKKHYKVRKINNKDYHKLGQKRGR